MAILNTGLISRTYSVDNDNNHSYVYQYRVEVDSYAEDLQNIASAPGISIGDSLGTYAKCTSINVEQSSEDGSVWSVSISFGKVDPEKTANPVDRLPKKTWTTQPYQKLFSKTIDNKPILNSAKDPFNEPIEGDDSRVTLQFTRNEATFNEELAYAYRDAVNSDKFANQKPGTVKVMGIQANRQFDSQYGYYYEVTYNFQVNKNGWDVPVLDQGFNFINLMGEKEKIMLNNQPVNEPQLLNGDGLKLIDGAPAVFLKFRIYAHLPFSVFNLS